MKKTLLLLLTALLLLSAASAVRAENAAPFYTQLLTDSTWILEEETFRHQDREIGEGPESTLWCLKAIRLPNDEVVISGDESGRAFITYFPKEDECRSAYPLASEISFDAEYKTMIAVTQTFGSYNLFKYVRQDSM